MLVSSVAALSKLVHRLRKDNAGVTAIEYGLIAGAIAIVIIGTVATVGSDLKTAFTNVSTCLTSPSATCGGGTN